MALSMLSMQEKNVIVRLSDAYFYLSETEEMKKIEAFTNKPDFKNLLNYEIATLNGIPAESNALLMNFINRINSEEELYQKSIQPQTQSDMDSDAEGGNDITPMVKPKIVRTVPITMRPLTENRTYTMKSQEDVDQFIEEMRQKLYDRLGEDTVIKLS